MKLAATLAITLLLTAVVAGCGASDEGGDSTPTNGTAPKAETSGAPIGARVHICPVDAGGTEALRATAVSCGEATRLALAWHRQAACAPAGGASRAGCSVRRYRCTAATTDRGAAVSCARPGRSVAFVAPR